MDETIQNSLARFIAVELLKQPRRVIRPDEPLITSGLVDSFSLVDLAIFIERQYGVVIDNTELTSNVFNTLDELTVLIADRKSR